MLIKILKRFKKEKQKIQMPHFKKSPDLKVRNAQDLRQEKFVWLKNYLKSQIYTSKTAFLIFNKMLTINRLIQLLHFEFHSFIVILMYF